MVWLSSKELSFKTFVNLCVVQILKKSQKTQWRHNPGTLNNILAKLTSRTASMSALFSFSNLKKREDLRSSDNQNLTQRNRFDRDVSRCVAEKHSTPSRFDWAYLTRVVAYRLRFVRLKFL